MITVKCIHSITFVLSAPVSVSVSQSNAFMRQHLISLMSLLIAEIMYDLIERKLHHSNRRDDSHSQHRHHNQLQHKYELNHHFVANS